MSGVEDLEKFFPSQAKRAGGLIIGGCFSPSAVFLPRVLGAFNQAHPNTQFTLRSEASRTIEELVIHGEIELGVVSTRPKSPQLAVESCGRQKLVVFAAVNHPLTRKPPRTLEELLAAPLVIIQIGIHPGDVETKLRGLTKRQNLPNIVMRCGSPDAVKSAVREGLGLGILPRDFLNRKADKEGFKMIAVPGFELYREEYLIHRKKSTLSPAGEELLALLRKWRETRSQD